MLYLCMCVLTQVYFHNIVDPLLPRVTVSLCLLHADRMCRIATGISAALIDAPSQKPAYKATDWATVFSQTPARHALSIAVHAEPGLIHKLMTGQWINIVTVIWEFYESYAGGMNSLEITGVSFEAQYVWEYDAGED